MEFVPLIISTVAGLKDSILDSISNFVNFDQSVDAVKVALDELTEARKDLENQVSQAELLGLTCTNQVKGWLERVKDVEAEVTSIIQDIESARQHSCYGCCNSDCSKRYKLGKKMRQKLMIINELKEKKMSDDNVANGHVIVPVVEIPSRPAIGLDMMLEGIDQLLRMEKVTTVGIYGMGGVGKTTLLKKINNELTRSLDFDVVIWAVASKDYVAEKIQQAIVARLGLAWDENEVQEQISAKIYNAMRKKKFLLLLDDLWKGVDLEKLGIPLPSKDNKSKVVFTTRTMDVCSDMDADRKIKVEFLKQREAWLLFCEKFGRTELLSSEPIRSYADTIVRKCGGLPLALITMGRVMANKVTEEEWQYTIQVLDNSPTELRGMEDVFTLLKFSYQNLGTETLRLCFLYCTLFPEDYSIEIEQLIEYWVGEGFLDNSYEGGAYNMGHAIIGSLKAACFLEAGEVESQVKMHDVVRNFALWIASECGEKKMKYLVQPSTGLTEAPRVENWELAQRISLWDNAITELPKVLACPHLLTLLLQWNSGLSKIPNGFFQSMPSLQVLDLSFTSIREIPTSISELVELRHLDLSRTKLSTLPKQLGSLQKLRHLDLQRTYLRSIPCEAIKGLSQMRILNLYYSYGSWEVQDSEYENELTFADLECLRQLGTLGITVTESHTLKRLAVSTALLRCIQYLYITECEGLHVLPLSTLPEDGKRLRRLSINNCRDLMYLKIGVDVGKNWLPYLEVLAMHHLPSLIVVWRNPVTRGCLQNLRSVNIWYCDKLKNVSWIMQLPKLEMIYLFYCKEMEAVIGEDKPVDAETEAFPRLRTISIRELPALTSIAQQAFAFPSLQRIAVINCPRLKKLPLKVSDDSVLPTVYGDKEWWDGLEWEADAARPAFFPPFIAT